MKGRVVLGDRDFWDPGSMDKRVMRLFIIIKGTFLCRLIGLEVRGHAHADKHHA